MKFNYVNSFWKFHTLLHWVIWNLSKNKTWFLIDIFWLPWSIRCHILTHIFYSEIIFHYHSNHNNWTFIEASRILREFQVKCRCKYCFKFSEIILDVSLTTGSQFFQLEFYIEYWVLLDDNINSIGYYIINNSALIWEMLRKIFRFGFSVITPTFYNTL